MSDGNFNRALLPHTPYASGMKMGQAMARARAEQAFRQWLAAERPGMSEVEAAEQVESFRKLMG